MQAGAQSDIEKELVQLRTELAEANLTLEAIRTGQVDALLVESEDGPQLYTLQSADQTYRFFIEQMKEGAITVDPNGVILFSNSQFAKFLDEELSAVVGRKLGEFIAPADFTRFVQLQQDAWENTCKGEFLLKGSDNYFAVQLSMTPLQLDFGTSLSILVTDLREQKDTENALKESNERMRITNRALEESNHDLQQFASVASHDLQEPVRKIQIFSSIIQSTEKQLSTEGRNYLGKVISSAERMRMLIVDILNYSRLSANENILAEISLPDLIQSVLDDFEWVISEKNVLMKVSPLPVIMGNPGQIRQVVQNLLSNAMKFVRPEIRPEIEITARRVNALSFEAEPDNAGAFWQISIADNGIGFEEQYAQNIFSLFERLNGKDKFEGTGIGLAIAKKIIEKHGGIIAAFGKPGQGAEFSFIIPERPISQA